MDELTVLSYVALCVPALPALVFAWIGLCMLLGKDPGQRIAWIVSWAFSLSALSALILAIDFVIRDSQPIRISTWGESAAHMGYAVMPSFVVDRLSAPMMVLTAIVCGLVSHFSSTYMVVQRGQPRFYLVLTMFGAGMFSLVMAGSADFLIAGWELVGLASTLLIGFFQERTFPVRNALRTFVVYRVCDIGLLTGALLLHHYGGTGDFVSLFGPEPWVHGRGAFTGPGATVVGLSFLWAACGKSALFPVGSWLPRAMEGPTPSSAIFYGALSVHAGAYLMIRLSPVLQYSVVARTAVIVLGAVTALHGTAVERVQSDVKSQLAYATSTQVGLIFVEIGLGFPRLALVHLMSHALLRTLQFLRAPNAIQDSERLISEVQANRRLQEEEVAAASQMRPSVSRRFSQLNPVAYHFALERFHLEAIWDRVLVRPIAWLAGAAEQSEQGWTSLVASSRVWGGWRRPAAHPSRQDRGHP